MKISKNGLNLIKKWEGGPWLTAKRFGTEKYLSIGYGHYGSDVKMGQKITKAQAEELLKKDVSGRVKHVNSINTKYGYKFNQNEFDALVSFAYNVGSITQLTNNGKRTKAEISKAMLLYVKNCGKTLQGLVNRRKDEQKLFNTPISTPTPAPAPAKPKKKTNAEIAKEVLAGKWGNGTERKKKLESAGYNYASVQKEVNKLLKG